MVQAQRLLVAPIQGQRTQRAQGTAGAVKHRHSGKRQAPCGQRHVLPIPGPHRYEHLAGQFHRSRTIVDQSFRVRQTGHSQHNDIDAWIACQHAGELPDDVEITGPGGERGIERIEGAADAGNRRQRLSRFQREVGQRNVEAVRAIGQNAAHRARHADDRGARIGRIIARPAMIGQQAGAEKQVVCVVAANHAILPEHRVIHRIVADQRTGMRQRGLAADVGGTGLHHQARFAQLRRAPHGGAKPRTMGETLGKQGDHTGVAIFDQVFEALDVVNVGLVAGADHQTEADAALLRTVDHRGCQRPALRHQTDRTGEQGARQKTGRAEQIDAGVAVDITKAIRPQEADPMRARQRHQRQFACLAFSAGLGEAAADHRDRLHALGATLGQQRRDPGFGYHQQRGIDAARNRRQIGVAGQAADALKARIDRIDGAAIAMALQVFDEPSRHAVARRRIEGAALGTDDCDTAGVEQE